MSWKSSEVSGMNGSSESSEEFEFTVSRFARINYKKENKFQNTFIEENWVPRTWWFLPCRNKVVWSRISLIENKEDFFEVTLVILQQSIKRALFLTHQGFCKLHGFGRERRGTGRPCAACTSSSSLTDGMLSLVFVHTAIQNASPCPSWTTSWRGRRTRRGRAREELTFSWPIRRNCKF